MRLTSGFPPDLFRFIVLKVETELRVLTDSEVPESKEGKGALVMKLKQNLIKQLETLLFNNTLDTEGGEDVRQLFHEFQENILKVWKMRFFDRISA